MKLFLSAALLLSSLGPILAQYYSLGYYRDVYTREENRVGFRCVETNGRVITWGRNRRVRFSDDQIVLFDSAVDIQKTNLFPFIAKTQDNTTVFIQDNNGRGWRDVGCEPKVTKTTIPYFYGPKFRRNPSNFVLNQKFTIYCDGGVSPNGTLKKTFWFQRNNNNAIPFATISNGQSFAEQSIDGLKISHDFQGNIEIMPTDERNHGTYGCNLTLIGSNSQITLSSSPSYDWNTNSAFSITTNLLLMIIGSISALLISAQY